MSDPRRAVLWAAFEVSNPTVTDEHLQEIMATALGMFGADAGGTERLGIEFKGCKARILEEGEEPPVFPSDL